jgi:hypothetical protein
MLRRRYSAGARQSNPYSCIDSFFPTGDPVKDMLTLKNTMYNAQIRANNAPKIPSPPEVAKSQTEIIQEELKTEEPEESKVSQSSNITTSTNKVDQDVDETFPLTKSGDLSSGSSNGSNSTID